MLTVYPPGTLRAVVAQVQGIIEATGAAPWAVLLALAGAAAWATWRHGARR